MEVILILGFAIVVMAIVLGRKKTYTPPESSMADPAIFRHYETQNLFANKAELAFFHAVSRALPPQLYLLTKPRLEDVIGVKRDLPNPKLAFQLRGRVKSRHVDFVIIDGQGQPKCGIELDGRSHASRKAKAGDHLKDGIFSASGLPLHRVIVGEDFHQSAKDIIDTLLF